MNSLSVHIKTLDAETKFTVDHAEVFSSDNILHLTYHEPENLAVVTISLDSQGLNIVRRSKESTTAIHCVKGHKTQAGMSTPYGEQTFDVLTHEIVKSPGFLSVCYELYSGDLMMQRACVYYQYNERGLN